MVHTQSQEKQSSTAEDWQVSLIAHLLEAMDLAVLPAAAAISGTLFLCQQHMHDLLHAPCSQPLFMYTDLMLQQLQPDLVL